MVVQTLRWVKKVNKEGRGRRPVAVQGGTEMRIDGGGGGGGGEMEERGRRENKCLSKQCKKKLKKKLRYLFEQP